MKWLKTIIILIIIGVLVLNATAFLHNVLVPEIQKERALTKKKAILITLDFTHPDSKELADFALGKTALDPKRWPEFIRYYTLVTEAIPNLAEAYFLIGYCSWQNNGNDKAIESFTKAAQLNPYLFWSYYDLGIAMLKQGQDQQAAIILNFAVHIPPRPCIQTMLTSKIYTDLLSSASLPVPQLIERLNQGYTTASQLLALSVKLAQKPDDEKAQTAMNGLLASTDLQIF